MVLSILIATTTAPALLGSQEAIRQGQSKDKREEHRARRCNLVASCVKPTPRSKEIDGRPIVLRNGKLWIDANSEDGQPFGHAYAGYYLPYPDTKYEGLVTTITDVAPIMNWVYVDKVTHEVKYGVRADAQDNLTVPFDCTRQDRRLTFDGWEGWCAVEEYEGYWCLYFDVDDDGLKSKIAPGIRVLEIELSRKEKRFKRDTEARKEDQTTKRAVETEHDAPVDRPLQQEPDVEKPGVFGGPTSEMEPVEDALLKTPPPAYSKLNTSVSPPSSNRLRNGAVDALDELLATEAQNQALYSPSKNQTATGAPQRLIPVDEKRAAPKLNRNSGSKTITQAQKFEAMASAQLRNNDVRQSRASGIERASFSSSVADSVSMYSEGSQRQGEGVRPSSSISQRADGAISTIKSQAPGPIDPAIFVASIDANSKRTSRASDFIQQRRTSRTFTARRPGKRVSPRNSSRKSLTDTMSSDIDKKGIISSSKSTVSLRVPREGVGAGKKTQMGRKTTSTILRDLDDMISQELVSARPKSGRKSAVAGIKLPPRLRESRNEYGRASQRSVKRK